MGPEDYEDLADHIMDRILRKDIPCSNGKGGNSSSVPSPLDGYRVATSIGVCHAMMNWGGDRHLLALRAEGVVACLFYTMCACIGEARHFYRVGPGSASIVAQGKDRAMTTDPSLFVNKEREESFKVEGGACIGRGDVYNRTNALPLIDQLRAMKDIAADLAQPGWEGSFGGNSWQNAALLSMQLGRALILFCNSPSKLRWDKVALLYNRTINAVHNNGKVMTKWISPEAFVQGAKIPTLCFINPIAALTTLGFYDPKISHNQLSRQFRREMKETK